MDMVFLYYDNPQMLAAQIECWNSYVGVLKKPPTILLVDDGSPKTSAVKVVRQSDCRVPIKVFRIKEDIAWNFPGARNLGCTHAKGWIYLSDIDTLLPSRDAKQLFEKHVLDPELFYLPERVLDRDSSPLTRSVSTVLFHKKKYNLVSGYDEDYAGFYGRDDRDYITRLGRVARLAYVTDVFTRAVLRADIKDATTRGLDRDDARNKALFLKKKAAGFPKIGPRLRFSWKRVL